MKRSTLALLALSTLPLYLGSAHALELDGDFYAVASAGRALKSTSPVQADYDAMLKPQGGQGTTTSLRSNQTADKNGYKLQLGYKLTNNFALEGGYVRLGKTHYDANYSTTVKVPMFDWWPKGPTRDVTTAKTASREVEYSGINLALVASNHVSDDLSLFAKVGVLRARAEASDRGFANSTEGKTKWRPILGVGADYFFDDMFGVRAEYERYNKLGDRDTVGTMDINMMSLGLIGKF